VDSVPNGVKMFKKNLLFLGVFFAVSSLVEAPRSIETFWNDSFSGPAGDPLCADDERSWQNLADLSQRFIGLKISRHIGKVEPEFAEFLTAFVKDDEVAALLAQRPEIVYRDRSVGGLSSEEAAAIHGWLTAFKAAVESERFNGQLLTPVSEKNLPITIEIKFPDAPGVRREGYVVKLLCRNGWRLGFYDDKGNDCNLWGCKAISPFPFTFQMVSRCFYEDWMRELNESFVRVARNYLFPLPGTEGLPLDDWDVFVVQEDFVVPANQPRQSMNAMLKIGEFPEFLRKTRGYSFKNPVNYFFRKDGTQMVVRNLERPAMGGSHAYNFLVENWMHSLDVHVNSGVGLVSLFKSFFKGLGLDLRIEEIFGPALDEGVYSDDEDADTTTEGSASGGSRRK